MHSPRALDSSFSSISIQRSLLLQNRYQALKTTLDPSLQRQQQDHNRDHLLEVADEFYLDVENRVDSRSS